MRSYDVGSERVVLPLGVAECDGEHDAYCSKLDTFDIEHYFHDDELQEKALLGGDAKWAHGVPELLEVYGWKRTSTVFHRQFVGTDNYGNQSLLVAKELEECHQSYLVRMSQYCWEYLDDLRN